MPSKTSRVGLVVGVAVTLSLVGGLAAFAEDAPSDGAQPTTAQVVDGAENAQPSSEGETTSAGVPAENQTKPAPVESDEPQAANSAPAKVAPPVVPATAVNLTARIDGCVLRIPGSYNGGYDYTVGVYAQGRQYYEFQYSATTTGDHELVMPLWQLFWGPPTVLDLVVSVPGTGYSATFSTPLGVTGLEMVNKIEACMPGNIPATLVPNPAKVKRGEKITFEATGFFYGEPLAMYIDDKFVGEGEVNEFNEGTFVWEVPADFPLGKHKVSARQREIWEEDPVPYPYPTVAGVGVGVRSAIDQPVMKDAFFEVVAESTTPPATPPTTPPATTETPPMPLAVTGFGGSSWVLAALAVLGLGAAMRLRKA